MKRFIRQMGLVFAGVFLLLALFDVTYTWIISENSLLGIGKNEKVDYLLLGDSRSVMLNADYLSEVTGKKVVNIACDGCSFIDILNMTDYFFKEGNRTDTVIIQMDPVFGWYMEPHVTFLYYAHLTRQKGILSPRIPFKYYLENRGKIKFEKVWKSVSNILNGETGYKSMDIRNLKPSRFTPVKKFMRDDSKESFRIDRLVDFKKYLVERGVKDLIVYTAPILPAWAMYQTDPTSYKNMIREAGFQYEDLSNLYKDTVYFRDHLHLNFEKYIEYNRFFAERVMSSSQPR